MKVLSSNMAMLSPVVRSVASDESAGSHTFVSDDVWAAVAQMRPDLLCMNEVRPGCMSSDWERQIVESTGIQTRITFPSSSSFVGLVLLDLSLDVVLRENVVQTDRMAFSCTSCEADMRDSTRHAYIECEKVQSLWMDLRAWFLVSLYTNSIPESLEELHRLVSSTNSITYRDVIFAFPSWKAKIKRKDSPEWQRLLLWHSAVVVTIHEIREQAFSVARKLRCLPEVSYANAMSRFKKEYKMTLVDMYKESTRLDTTQSDIEDITTTKGHVARFKKLFILNNSIVRNVEYGGFSFA